MSKLVTALIILLSIAVLWMGQEVFIPLVLSFMLAMLLAGPVTKLEKWRWPRVLAVSLVVSIAIGLLVFIAWIVGNQVYTLTSNLDQYQGEILSKVRSLKGEGPSAIDKMEELGKKIEQAANTSTTQPNTQPSTNPATRSAETIPNVGTLLPVLADRAPPATTQATVAVPLGEKDNPLYAFVIPVKQSPLSTLSGYLGFVLPPLGTAGIVFVFVFFILLQREDLRDRMIRLVSQGRYTLTTTAVDDGVDRIIKYVRAQAIVNGTYGLLVAIGLWAIGAIFGQGLTFPNFLLWGLLAAVLRFVPYIGPWIAAAFPLTISLAAYPGFTMFAVVVLFFVLIELGSNNIMEPMLYGSTTGLSVMAILVSAIFWTWLWGPVGLLLATPLTVILMVLGTYVPGLGFLEVLLGDKPAMMPKERVYQRLLAGDEDEALGVLQDQKKETSLLMAFDDVLLPALAMAEQDAAQGLLEEDRHEMVKDGTRRIVEELASQPPSASDTTEYSTGAKPALTSKEAAAAAITAVTPGESVAKPNAVRVAVLPAHDESDELAGLMLARLLEQQGMIVLHLSHNALASEMIDEVQKFGPHVVFISATPPAAVSHVRYLLRRIQGKLPGEKLAIGVWVARSELETLKKRLETKDAPLATTLTGALEAIKRMTEQARADSLRDTTVATA